MKTYTTLASRDRSKPVTQSDFGRILLQELRTKIQRSVRQQIIPDTTYVTRRDERLNHQDMLINFDGTQVNNPDEVQAKLEELLAEFNREEGTLTGKVVVRIKSQLPGKRTVAKQLVKC